jgi:tRNA(Arg) A34 adenosine deaminase TadA
MFNEQQLSDIAQKLKAGNVGQDVAVAEDRNKAGTIYYAMRAARGKEPYSPAVRLIQIGKDAGNTYGKPMVSTATLTEMDIGMSGVTSSGLVVAKAASAAPVVLPGTVAPEGAHTRVLALNLADKVGWEERNDDLSLFEVPDMASPNVDVTSDARTNDHTGLHTVHRIYMMAAYGLLTARITSKTSGTPTGKNIGVLMVDPQGKIIACGVNTNSSNGTFHAEVNCLQSYYKFNKNGYGGFPANTRIYSTLEPCEMCAGMIWESASDNSRFLVYYGMVDPGQLAGQTKLSKTGRERLLSQWQEVSYRADKKSKIERPMIGEENPKLRQGPKAIKVYEQTLGPEAYSLAYTDYASYLEEKKSTSILSAADFMTGTNADKSIPQSIMKVNQSLLRKSEKYTTNPGKKPLNPNVAKVVAHVKEFLRQKKIVGF